MSDSSSSQSAQLRAEAQALVRAADAAWQAQDGGRVQETLNGFERILSAFPAEAAAPADATEVRVPDEFAEERAAIWLWRGRFLVAANSQEMVLEGLRSLDQAIGRLNVSVNRDAADESLSVAWMNRGSGLFRLGSPEAIAEGIRSYDQVIGLLEDFDGAENILGAAWMNRGVGILRLGKEEALPDAKKSLARAVGLLEPIVDSHPSVRRNLASALTNLGLVQAQKGEPAEAAQAHQRAVDVFRPLADGLPGPGMFELAARLFNLSQAYGAAGQTSAALNAGREALALAGLVATLDPRAVELALRTRHALCVVLGGLLAAGGLDADVRSAHLAEASDLVEDGLADLKTRGALPEDLNAAGARLYEYGTWFYRTQQPQFLAEFLLEHLGEDPVRANIAATAINAARQALVQRNFNDPSHGGMGRVIEMMKDLGEVDQRLKAIRTVS